MPNIAALCCCGGKAGGCCEPFAGGYSCGATFTINLDWTDVFYERAGGSCDPKYDSVASCDEIDCDLCAQESLNPVGPTPHCRYWSLTQPKVGQIGIGFEVCASNQGVSAAPIHNLQGTDTTYIDCAQNLACGCGVPYLTTCSVKPAQEFREWCYNQVCVGAGGHRCAAGHIMGRVLDGREAYTNDALVISSALPFTAKLTLCNRWVSPGDQALFPDNKDYFKGIPSATANCAYVQRRDLSVGPCHTRLNWVHLTITINDETYDYYCYGTANKAAEWANTIPGIVATGSDLWLGLRLPASAISPELDIDGGCQYAPTLHCDQVQSDAKLIDNEEYFMPDNSDDWLLQSTSANQVKWKARAAYWYNMSDFLVGCSNKIGGNATYTTITCGYNAPFCSGCVNCGTTVELKGTCAALPPCSCVDDIQLQCGLGPCLDIDGGDSCEPIIGCCNGFGCGSCNPCLAGPFGNPTARFKSTDYVPSLYGVPFTGGWGNWTLFSEGMNPPSICLPVSVQGGGYPQ